MNLQEKLGHLFEDLKLGPSDEVTVASSGAGHFLVVVASSTFEGRPEEDRQDTVWRRLIDGLDDDEQVRVDFAFTRTPKEGEEIRESVDGAEAAG